MQNKNKILTTEITTQIKSEITPAIKSDFKIFENYKLENGTDFTYLDSAATSLTPTYVVEKMNEYYYNYKSNIDRGLYKTAERATAEYENARVKVAQFIGAENDEVIFTSGVTDSSNKIVIMIESHLMPYKDMYKTKNEILVSDHAHHSDLVPLQEYAKRNGLTVVLAGENLVELITEKTLIVSCMYASNVTGEVFDIKSIATRAKEFKAFVLCDLTAAVGHVDLNVKSLDIDAGYFGAHKMCGPTGVGVLYVKRELLRGMNPSTYGGGMVWEVSDTTSTYRSDVKKFEAGTPNIGGVIGTGAAVDYINTVGLENIKTHVQDVTAYAILKLVKLGKEGSVKVFTKHEVQKNIGIISFEYVGVHAHDVAQVLADNHVAVRSGHHCAAPLMRKLCAVAVVRVSFYMYSSTQDVDNLILAIKKVRDTFKK